MKSAEMAAASLSPSSLSALLSSNGFLTFPECPEDSVVEAESEDDTAATQTSLDRPTPHRGNTMVHVCWHRNTSVSMVDFSIAVEVPSKPGPAPPLLPRRFLSLCPMLCCILIRLDYRCGNGFLLCCNNGRSGPGGSLLFSAVFPFPTALSGIETRSFAHSFALPRIWVPEPTE